MRNHRLLSSIIVICTITFSRGFVFGSVPSADAILAEGKMLCRLEKASWHATDIVKSEFPDILGKMGGYVSYIQGENVYTACYSRSDSNEIMIRFKFNNVPDKVPIAAEIGSNISTPYEKELINLRNVAVNEVMVNKDGFFSHFEKTSFNFIPVIGEKENTVFILTGGTGNDKVLFIGNDYLLIFDKAFKLKKKNRLHNSLISLPYKSDKEGTKAEYTIHSHVLNEFITSTDICTLLLYKDFVEWKKNVVAGKKYMSVLDLEKETLFFTTYKEQEKLYKK